MEKYLTPEGLEKFKKELDCLKIVKRKEIAERLKQAAYFGDLSENSAYQQAKEDQAFLENKIIKLEEIINNAKIIEGKKTDKVEIGSTVLLLAGEKKERFQITDMEESNPLEGKISYQSPFGQSLMGKKAGTKIKIETPDGKIQYQILKVD